MADFAKALKRGFDEVDRVWDARHEIEGVFEQLAKATSEVTSGAVRLVIEQYEPTSADETDRSVVAVSTRGRQPVIDFRQAHAGYPVELEPFYSTTRFVCGNKQELEEALAELLANIHIAERIRSLATPDAAE